MSPRLPAQFLLLAAFSLSVGCGGGGGGGKDPTELRPDPARSTVTVQTTTVPADGSTTTSILVTVLDAEGRPISGQDVRLTASGNGNRLTQPSAPTDAQGRATGALASIAAEPKTVGATVNPAGQPVVLSQNAAVEFTSVSLPLVQGFARYVDVDLDARVSTGDTVTVPFNTPIVVSGGQASDFALPVDQDSFGQGATLVPGPAANEVTIRLGTDASIRTRGLFDPANTVINSPSGIDVNGIASAIRSLSTDTAAIANVPIDILPAYKSVDGVAVPGTIASATGDINFDGDTDLVVATAGKLTLFTGNRTLDLVLEDTFVHTSIREIAISDLNRFTADEVITMHDTTVVVWNNDTTVPGQHSLAPAQILAAGQVNDFALVDVDLDGRLDIVTASADGIRVFLHQRNLGNTYTLLGSLNAGPTTAIDSADVDGDGDADLLLAREAGLPGRVLLNDGEGNFSTGASLGVTSIVGLSTGDVDGDGDIDVLAARDTLSSMLLRNDGTGTFSAGEVADPFRQALLHDVDGDSRPDIVATDGQTTSVWSNDRSGVFADSGVRLPRAATRELAIARLDADADAEVFVTHDAGVEILGGSLAGSQGTASLVPEAPLGNEIANAIAMADLDGDGDLDKVVANLGANQVWINDGKGTFSFSGIAGHILGAGDSRAVALGDLDGDGDTDAVIGNTGAANEIYVNAGDGTFQFAIAFATGSQTLSLALTLFDLDRRLDIVVGNDGKNQVFRNQSVGTAVSFLEVNNAFLATPNELDRKTIGLIAQDVDTDGDLDLVVLNEGAEPTQAFRLATELYSFDKVIGSVLPAHSMAMGDFDGDGIRDLAIGYSSVGGTQTVCLYRGLRIGFSTQPILVPTANQVEPRGLALADIDGDGRDDLVVGNFGAPSEWLRGDGTGAFQSAQVLGNHAITGLLTADIDADGDLDVVAVDGSPTGNPVYRNR